jgi:uncharacterized protein (TIGR01777 family)
VENSSAVKSLSFPQIETRPLRVVIAGGTGFLGRALTSRLTAAGHDVVVLTRHPPDARGSPRYVRWSPDGGAGDWAQSIEGADAVVNLAGEGLADRRWTTQRKAILRSSRIFSTRSLVAAIRIAARRPALLVGASGIGYYGDTGDSRVDESCGPGSDFLAALCVDWEAEAAAASALGCRVVVVRSGVVLAKSGGALQRMKTPFQFFVGGPIGSGRQFISWIHRDDWLSLVQWALARDEIAGPVNASSPAPVTNREFSDALGRALHRPAWLPVPRLALKILVGELADTALLSGQRAVPARALAAGFTFAHPLIDEALTAVFQT